MKKFNSFQSTDLDIYCKYNVSFQLPPCYKKSNCKCFPTLDVYFDSNNPLLYIVRMICILKRFCMKYISHQNLISLSDKSHLHQCSSENFKISLSYHLKTLSLFREYYNISENQFKKLGTRKYLKFLKFAAAYPSFQDFTETKCLEEIGKNENDKFVNSFYYNMSVFSHYHTLKMFQKFVILVSTKMKK